MEVFNSSRGNLLKVEIFREKTSCSSTLKKDLEETRMVLAPVNNRLVLEFYFPRVILWLVTYVCNDKSYTCTGFLAPQ